MKKFIAPLFMLLSVASSAQVALASEGDAMRGKVLFETCKGCHSIKNWQSVYPTYHVPLIWGQGKTYIQVALTGYRDGSRKHGSMSFNAGSLSDQDILDLATYINNQQ